ncbi:hypothetical protein FRB99_005058 [Tulasnella sp. 403]|nr:hypothetical protein FRB99_005058 [Tulasnella sp. 403]
MFKSLFLAFALFAALVAAVPTVKNPAFGRSARSTRREGDRSLSMNAKRFAAGLPPLRPSKLYDRATRTSPHVPRRSPGQPVTAPLVVIRTDTNRVYGYYYIDLFGGFLTYDPNNHSVKINGVQYMGSQPQDQPDLKPGLANMAWVIPEDGNGVVLALKTLDYATRRLTATWTNPDSSTYTTDEFWYYWFDDVGEMYGTVAYTADIDKLKTDFADGQAHWISVALYIGTPDS